MRNVAIVLLFVLLLPNAAAQQNRLSPEQQETVRQLKEQLLKDGDYVCFIRDSNLDKATTIENQFNDIDPILVGRNVVFGKNFLKYIEPNNIPKRQLFERWRESADMVYDSCVKLTGGPPRYGKIIFVDIFPFTQPHHTGGAHAHAYVSCCSGGPVPGPIPFTFTRDGEPGGAIIHEFGHIFSFGKVWDVDGESAAGFLTNYCEENTNEMWSGTGHRKGRFDGLSLAAYKNNERLPTFEPHKSSAWEFYLYALVEKVGWRPIEQAFQSYNDNPLNLGDNIMGEDRRRAHARDVLDRIAHFSGVPNVLQNLPDKGELFDEHFTPLTFEDRFAKLFPGWTIRDCPMNHGYGLQANHRNGWNVFRTHPPSQQVPCTLSRRMDIPANGQIFLKAVVSNYPNADWELVCRVNGTVQKTVTIDDALTKGGWVEVAFDLTSFAGRNVLIELENKANSWHYEDGFWASLTIDSTPPTPGRNLIEWNEKGVPVYLFTLQNQPADVRRVDLTWAAWESAEVHGDVLLRGRAANHASLPHNFLQVGGRRFGSGLYAHAPALHKFDLGGNWKTFTSSYGIQDGMPGSVVFVVRGDGKELARSALIRDRRLRRLQVNVSGVSILELIVEDGGDGISSDWGLWIEPTLEREVIPPAARPAPPPVETEVAVPAPVAPEVAEPAPVTPTRFANPDWYQRIVDQSRGNR